MVDRFVDGNLPPNEPWESGEQVLEFLQKFEDNPASIWRGSLHLDDWPENDYLNGEYGLFKRDKEKDNT